MKTPKTILPWINNCFIKITQFLLGSKIFKAVLIVILWLLSLHLLILIGLLKEVNGNLLIVVHLAMFFFALTASHTTWSIKWFGFEAGSNDPKHTHITINELSNSERIDIREYGDNDPERLIRLASEIQSKKP